MFVIKPPAREVDVHVLDDFDGATGASDCAVKVASGCVEREIAAACLLNC